MERGGRGEGERDFPSNKVKSKLSRSSTKLPKKREQGSEKSQKRQKRNLRSEMGRKSQKKKRKNKERNETEGKEKRLFTPLSGGQHLFWLHKQKNKKKPKKRPLSLP